MKCKYTFKVNGRLKPAHLIAFQVDGLIFEFKKTQSGFIDKILVSVYVTPDDSPSLITDTTKKDLHHINITSPRLKEIQEIMRQIEGVYALWGVESIEIDRPEHDWIAETDEERKKLNLYNFSIKTSKLSDSEIPTLPFDLIARSIISSVKDKKHDVVLSFNRRGKSDMKSGDYIDAIYKFYFIIETYFANGKFKTKQVKYTLKSSEKFVNIIKSIMGDQSFKDHLEDELSRIYENKYLCKPIDEVIDSIVDLRGYIHHFTEKRPTNWHPDRPEEFKLDAYVFEQIAFKISFLVIEDKVFSESVQSMYEEMIMLKNNGKKPSIEI